MSEYSPYSNQKSDNLPRSKPIRKQAGLTRRELKKGRAMGVGSGFGVGTANIKIKVDDQCTGPVKDAQIVTLKMRISLLQNDMRAVVEYYEKLVDDVRESKVLLEGSSYHKRMERHLDIAAPLITAAKRQLDQRGGGQ